MATTHSLQVVQRFRQRIFRDVLQGKPKNNDVPRVLNPFLPWKNPLTQHWRAPAYSLRQQADLVKHARVSNTLHLLPPGPKLLDPAKAAFTLYLREKGLDASLLDGAQSTLLAKEALQLPEAVARDPSMQPVIWEGKFDTEPKPGAELGTRLYAAKKKMFKGHRHERLAARKAVYRKALLRDMNRRIEDFREHHRRRRPHPLAEPRQTAKARIPF